MDTTKPTVTSIEDQTKVNTPVDSITIEATDNSGLAVSNKVSGLPEGVSFDSETNTISGHQRRSEVIQLRNDNRCIRK